jgi:tyrosyl-tRNA synthetase
MTRMIHGESELAKVEAATQALFGGDVRSLAEDMLREVFADVPHTEHASSELSGEGAALVDVLATTTLASSKREARQFLESGAVAVNGQKAEAGRRLTATDLLHGHTILLKRGKKLWHATRWK